MKYESAEAYYKKNLKLSDISFMTNPDIVEKK